MALRRRGSRVEGSVWPGFVDVMTALLLVLVFVLSIFMVIQFVLRDLVTGKDQELDNLTRQLGEIAQVLSLERTRAEGAEAEGARLAALLAEERDEVARLGLAVASLTEAREAAEARNVAFEAQVAGLLAQMAQARGEIVGLTARLETAEAARDDQAARAETAEADLGAARARVADLEAAEARAISEAEALNLALARLRDEIDAERESARRAAAEAAALEALTARLRAEAAAAETAEAEAQARAEALSAELTEAETARALAAEAAAALRARLEGADAELDAMTLALEEQRRRAEETLTLLAAASAARDAEAAAREVTAAELAEARAAMTEREALLAAARRELAEERRLTEDEARRVALLNAQAGELRRQLGQLQALLDTEQTRRADMEVQIATLGADLNAALARELSLQRREARRQADEIARLEAEKQSLEARRSEFFGRIAEAIGDRPEIRVVGDRFVFQSEVLFGPGSADLGPDGRAALSQFADLFDEVRDALPEELGWILRVDGHTDDVPLSGAGRFRDNWELSQARALSVVRYLAEVRGFPPDRLAANGFAEWQPLDPAPTPEARARNRRIELKLTER